MQANVHQLANQGCMRHAVKRFSIVQEYCTDVLASLQKLQPFMNGRKQSSDCRTSRPETPLAVRKWVEIFQVGEYE